MRVSAPSLLLTTKTERTIQLSAMVPAEAKVAGTTVVQGEALLLLRKSFNKMYYFKRKVREKMTGSCKS